MKATDWDKKFGNKFLFTLTNKERRYLGLSEIAPEWESQEYHSKTNLWYTRVTAFFEGNIIVKAISETKKVLSDGTIKYENYAEYDTNLDTIDRKQLIPLTSRGKLKHLSASNINSITPFGCEFAIGYDTGRDTHARLYNPRANRDFPVGEKDAIALIKSDEDFHDFMDYYIAGCREDYFDRLQAFKSATHVTVKYKAGDIFRMELDRTHYCYGIITGEVKKYRSMPELPRKHSLRGLMMVPIMVRFYQLITENPDLTANELCNIPLGRLDIVGDNDIIWGNHTIVDHKTLTPDDLEFNIVCTKIVSHSPHNTLFTQDMLIHAKLIPEQQYTLYIEWGFAQTSLVYEQLSDKLKIFLKDYSSPHGGVAPGIDPYNAVPDEKYRQHYRYLENLQNPHNKEFLNEIFACLGLENNTTFDQFAEKFGGLTRQQILCLMDKTTKVKR